MGDNSCSVPNMLRKLRLVPLETPRQQAACRRHDARYALSGDERARFISDLAFAFDLLGGDPDFIELLVQQILTKPDDGAMPATRAHDYLFGVRAYGASHWRGSGINCGMPLTYDEPPEAP